MSCRNPIGTFVSAARDSQLESFAVRNNSAVVDQNICKPFVQRFPKTRAKKPINSGWSIQASAGVPPVEITNFAVCRYCHCGSIDGFSE